MKVNVAGQSSAGCPAGIAVSKASRQSLGFNRLEIYETLGVIEYEAAFKTMIRNTRKESLVI